MFCKTYYISLVIFFCAVRALAQPTNNGFKKAEGLNCNVVYSVMQDSKGFLWVGTEAGASRYDGYKFTHYTIEEGLADNDVFQIKEDNKGRIWFLSNSGNPSIYENGYILNASNTAWLRDIQPKKLAKLFLQDKLNSIWYVTLDTAYHIINDKVAEKFAAPQLSSLPQNIQTLSIYKDTAYLVCNSEVYNTVTHKSVFLDSDKIMYARSTSTDFSDEHLFYIFKDTIYYFSFKTHVNKVVVPIPEHDIFLLMIKTNHPDTVLISTVHHLYKFNTKTRQLTDANISNINSITYVYKDREGNTWVSSLTNGLFIKEAENSKKLYKISAAGLPNNTACYSFSKVDNDLYIGYDDGYYIIQKGKYFYTRKLRDNKDIGKVQQIFKYRHNLFCSFNHGIITDLGSNKIDPAFSAKEIVAKEPYLYIASSTGLAKVSNLLNRKGSERKEIYINITEQRVSKLLLDSDDSLYAGGGLGLQLFVHEKPVYPLPWHNNITNASITKIIKTTNSHIVFSTENMGLGIICNDSIYAITKQNGLLSNSITEICSSQPGLIWLAMA